MLQCCIGSIRRHSARQHQVIIHINDGSDGTLQWVAAQSDLIFTHSPINIGICEAMNTMRTRANSDYIVYLNDDMYVLPQWDAAFARAIDDAAVEGKGCRFFLSAILIEPRSFTIGSIEKDFGTSLADFRENELLAQYSALALPDRMGAIYPPNLVHRSVWDLAGGYSIEFSPGMASDDDFAAKLWRLGIRHFRMVGDCMAYHFGRISTSRIRHNNGKAVFLQKWGHTFRTFRTYLLHFGTVATQQNIALPVFISSRTLRINRLKALRYSFSEFLFGKNKL